MNEKEQTNTMRYIDKLICDVEKVLTGLGYKVSIELNDRTKVWLHEKRLDYHHMIEDGSALEAPEGMYN